MPQTTKTEEPVAQNNAKLTLILVIVFGSVSVLLLAYIALRVTIGPHNTNIRPGGQPQLQQRYNRFQGNQPNVNQNNADPMDFNEEMNLN